MKNSQLALVHAALMVFAVFCFIKGATPKDDIYIVLVDIQHNDQTGIYPERQVISYHLDEKSALVHADSYNKAIKDKKYFVGQRKTVKEN